MVKKRKLSKKINGLKLKKKKYVKTALVIEVLKSKIAKYDGEKNP